MPLKISSVVQKLFAIELVIGEKQMLNGGKNRCTEKTNNRWKRTEYEVRITGLE